MDSLVKLANERLKRKKQKDELEKLGKQGDMLNPAKYEKSMGIPELFGKRKKEEDEDEEA